jgi:biotin operon repressor
MKLVEHPSLGRLTYPDSTPDEAIHSDIRSRLLKSFEPKPKTSAFGQVKEFGKGLFPGAGGLLEQAAKGVAGYGADVLQQRFGVGPGAEPVVGGISALTQKYVKDPIGEYFEPAPGYEVAPKLGQAVGSIAGIALTRPFGRGAPFTTGMGAGAGEQIERTIEAGATPQQRMQAAGLGAAVGITEALPVELAFARTMKLMPGSVMNQGLQIIRNATLVGGVEGAQEAAQNFLQNLIAKNIYKPDQELIEGVGEGAAYGAGAGAIFKAALDLIGGRRAVKKAQEAKTPEETAEKIAEEVTNPELTEEEKKQRQRAEIRQKQLDRGINLIDEDDLTALGLKPGKKAEEYNKLLGKNLSDPDELQAIRKTFDTYLSGSRQKINDITTIQKVLDKQIAGEPLNLFETLVVKNYNGEDIDAYLDELITNLQARGPAAVVPPIPTPEIKPKTAKEIAKEQANISKQEFIAREEQAKQAGKERKESQKQLRQLKELGVPVEAVTRGEALAGAQPDLFGDITTQQGTRGTGAEAEFARQRAQFEEDLRQLRVASGAAVAGVPDADTVVQATAAKIKQDIATIPFTVPELIQIRSY